MMVDFTRRPGQDQWFFIESCRFDHGGASLDAQYLKIEVPNRGYAPPQFPRSSFDACLFHSDESLRPKPFELSSALMGPFEPAISMDHVFEDGNSRACRPIGDVLTCNSLQQFVTDSTTFLQDSVA